MARTAHHLGATPSSERRIMRKYSTTAMANTITKISSMVMPEVMCPKPFSMRSGCCRWKNTDRPPMASATIALMQEASCMALPLPDRVRMPCIRKMPPARQLKKVKRIRGH